MDIDPFESIRVVYYVLKIIKIISDYFRKK